MEIIFETITKETRGNTDIIDITPDVREKIGQSSLRQGSVLLFVPGSTGALTTIEYEPGLLQDLPEFFEQIIPSNRSYHHDRTWGDGNGYSHLRASLVGPSLNIPFYAGELVLGTWQQIIFIDFDNRPRHRKIIVHIIGE
ncbi:MAG: YjbQ family protein [Calditrichaeota bacterium]|nr:YjbQ family protein [Calditrichota bacterium]